MVKFIDRDDQRSFAEDEIEEHIGKLDRFGASRWIGEIDTWNL
jgi:hypothetical protein